MTDDEILADFQATLLELLDEHDDPDLIIATLRNDRRWMSLSSYLETFEPRMVSVAAELVKKWGRRTSK